MSKIKNGGLDQYGAEAFEQQQFGRAGVEWVNIAVTVSGVCCNYCVAVFTHSVVLRNYMAQTAIEEADKGNYSKVKRILSLLEKPFDDRSTSADSDVITSHRAPGEYS